jgi:hypothetical protein
MYIFINLYNGLEVCIKLLNVCMLNLYNFNTLSYILHVLVFFVFFFVDNQHSGVNKYFKMKEEPKDKFVLVVTYICLGLICKIIK